MHLRTLHHSALVSTLLLLTGCGLETAGGNGTLTLRITDAPVDDAEHVYVRFRGIELHASSGDSRTYYYCQGANASQTVVSTTACATYQPKQLDLLALTGGVSDTLLNDITLPAGRYEWVRLIVDTADVRDSYIVLAGGAEHELTIPSGEQNGLKLNRGFDVPAGGGASFTVDFDLRKSVHLPMSGSDYLLRPTLRIVDNAQAGHIAGTVANALVTTGCSPAVYVFAGSGVTPDDIDGTAPDPVTTATVSLNNTTGQYTFKAGYLEAGSYTLAFTCQAAQDDPATNDAIAFSVTMNATVNANATTNVGIVVP